MKLQIFGCTNVRLKMKSGQLKGRRKGMDKTRMQKNLAILLAILFLATVTVTTVSSFN